jgi:hypothetical protein
MVFSATLEGRLRLGRDAGGEQVRMQERRIGCHRLLDVDHVGQDLVLDLDQASGCIGDLGSDGGGDGGHRMAGIQHLAARHAIQGDRSRSVRAFAMLDRFVAQFGEIGGGDDGLHAGQCRRPWWCRCETMRAWACGLRFTCR